MAGWTAFFLLPATGLEHVPGWLFAIVPLSTLAMLLLDASPVLAAAIVLGALEMTVLGGLDFGEIEMLLPMAAVLGHLGRTHPNPWLGPAVVIAFAAVSAQRADFEPEAFLAGAIIYGTVWGLGRLVHRRSEGALRAVRRAERTASVDLVRITSDSAAEERRRITRSTIEALRDALGRIAVLAGRGTRGAWPDEATAGQLALIARVSDATLARLRRALGSMRGVDGEAQRRGDDAVAAAVAADPHRAADPGRAPDPVADEGRTRWRRALIRALAAVGGGVCMLGGAALLGGSLDRPAFLVPALLMPIAVAIGRSRPLTAGLLALAALGAAAVDSPHPPSALLPTGIAVAMLVWQQIVDLEEIVPARLLADRRRASGWNHRVGLACTALGAGLLAWQHGRSGLGFIVVLLFVSTSCAIGWSDRDRVTQREEARASRHLAEAAAARLQAQRDERRRLGRELHDIVSHAVVGISLQAQAAVLDGADAGVRAQALDTIERTARRAIDELTALATRVGGAGAPQLETLVADGERLGLRVEAEIDETAAYDGLVRCIVRECLTNAARHAPGSRVRVRTGIERETLVVEVHSRPGAEETTGSASDRSQPSGLRQGLRGLADRVAARGGQFIAGPDGDGFAVIARFPPSLVGTVSAERGDDAPATAPQAPQPAASSGAPSATAATAASASSTANTASTASTASAAPRRAERRRARATSADGARSDIRSVQSGGAATAFESEGAA